MLVDRPREERSKERFDEAGKHTAVRTLRDGSEHQLVKVHLDPADLEALFDEDGWRSSILVDDGWIMAAAERRPLSSG